MKFTLKEYQAEAADDLLQSLSLVGALARLSEALQMAMGLGTMGRSARTACAHSATATAEDALSVVP